MDKEKLVLELTKDILTSKYEKHSAGDLDYASFSTIAECEINEAKRIAAQLINDGWVKNNE